MFLSLLVAICFVHFLRNINLYKWDVVSVRSCVQNTKLWNGLSTKFRIGVLYKSCWTVCVCVCVYVGVCVCVYVCMYVCVYVYVCV